MNTTKQVDNDIANALRALGKEVGAAVEKGRRTCVNCLNFDEHGELCMLAGQRPPARVIALGCEAFTPDIPF